LSNIPAPRGSSRLLKKKIEAVGAAFLLPVGEKDRMRGDGVSMT
jgi:hypothetical protein